jgi:hypothetical protein
MHVPAWPVLPSSTLAPEAIRAKFAARSLAGLGVMVQDPFDGSWYDDGTVAGTGPGGSDFGPLCPAGMTQIGQSCMSGPLPPSSGGWGELPLYNVGGSPGYQVPSQSSAQWGILAAQLLKSGMTLAQIQSIQPGTVVSANGAILRQATGLPVPVTSSSTTLGLNASPNTTTLLIAVAAVAAVMFMGRGGR